MCIVRPLAHGYAMLMSPNEDETQQEKIVDLAESFSKILKIVASDFKEQMTVVPLPHNC